MTTTARVYGFEGHRQKHSFVKSYSFKDWNEVSFDVRNSDKTGTNEYTEVAITAIDEDTAVSALEGQLSDGIFENCRVGKIEIL